MIGSFRGPGGSFPGFLIALFIIRKRSVMMSVRSGIMYGICRFILMYFLKEIYVILARIVEVEYEMESIYSVK